NLTVLTGAHAERILLDGRRAAGVSFLHQGARRLARAHSELILAAGAIGSPQLLQLSGIGPGPLLQSLGIAVEHELPGVGQNLQDHLQLRLIYKVEGAKTLNTLAGSI